MKKEELEIVLKDKVTEHGGVDVGKVDREWAAAERTAKKMVQDVVKKYQKMADKDQPFNEKEAEVEVKQKEKEAKTYLDKVRKEIIVKYY